MISATDPIHVQATAQQVLPTVENLGFKIPATQRPGKAITLVGRVRINDFGERGGSLGHHRAFFCSSNLTL